PPDSDAKRPTVEQMLAGSRLDELHRRGYRGQGVRVVVVASEFAGAAELIGKGLPACTRIVDLTAEPSPASLPAPPCPNRPAAAAGERPQGAGGPPGRREGTDRTDRPLDGAPAGRAVARRGTRRGQHAGVGERVPARRAERAERRDRPGVRRGGGRARRGAAV